jgi:hypothetical protein
MRAIWFLAVLTLLALAPLSSDAQLFGIWRTPGGGSSSCLPFTINGPPPFTINGSAPFTISCQ